MNERQTEGLSADFHFCPVLEELLRDRRVVGRTGKVFEGLGALSTYNNLLTLRRLVLETNATRTLEIGCAFGGSALIFAASHSDLGHEPSAEHLVLDPYQETVWDSSGLQAIERAGLAGHVDFRPVCSAVELPKLLERGERFDLVYVDGSHLFEDVFVDAYFVVRLLSKGGVVAFDDSANPHVAKVLRYLRTSLRGGLEEIDLSAHRDTSRARIARRIAARLGRVQMTAFRREGAVEREWNAPFCRF